MNAQEGFSERYADVTTPTVVFRAGDSDGVDDVFVHNRAMDSFATDAASVRLFNAPGSSRHELLLETLPIRSAVGRTIISWFTQTDDSVDVLTPAYPLEDSHVAGIKMSWQEISLRSVGALVATVGLVTGISLIYKGRPVI
jgi:hypothetical protein